MIKNNQDMSKMLMKEHFGKIALCIIALCIVALCIVHWKTMEVHCSFVHYSLVKILFFDGCEYSSWFGFILAILDASLIRVSYLIGAYGGERANELGLSKKNFMIMS